MKCRRRRPGRVRRESLLLRFGIVSAILAALFGVVLTTWLGSFIRTTNIQHARDTAEYSLKLSINVMDVPAGQSAVITPAQLALTTALMRGSVATGTFVGATSWTAPGIVTYAGEPGRIGRMEKVRPQILATFKGQKGLTAIITQPLPGVPDVTERNALRKVGPLLEIYQPVRLRGKIVAGVALYQPWTPVQRLISRETRQMLLLVLAGLLVLWLGVMRLVLSASRRLRAQSRENWMLASHDPLTGLPNRTLLEEQLSQALKISERSGGHVGLLLFDLDHFKEVNDTLGHACGDLLLQQIGPRLTSVLREGDFVARLGGDEFVIVLPRLKRSDEATAAATRLLEALSEPFHLDSVTLDVDASIGVAVSPEHGTDGEALLRHADTGMYQAKKAGNGFATYSAEAEYGRPTQRPLLDSLRAALQDPQQFALAYQPKADVQSGVVHGVEALLRWQHPTLGALLPGDFLPVAERTGLILPLTDLVIDAVLGQIRAWGAEGFQLGVSINVSACCLLDAAFPTRVGALLQSHDVEPGMLEFEITEKVILDDINRAVAVLGRLDELGVRLALDGFGSGFSSMGYLKRLPVHQIKIDSSLVTDLTEASTDAAIVRSCIELARNLGLSVVAEGVETAGVWHQLARYGCHLAQGSYLADPMTGEQLPAWLQERARAAKFAKSARRSVRGHPLGQGQALVV